MLGNSSPLDISAFLHPLLAEVISGCDKFASACSALVRLLWRFHHHRFPILMKNFCFLLPPPSRPCLRVHLPAVRSEHEVYPGQLRVPHVQVHAPLVAQGEEGVCHVRLPQPRDTGRPIMRP